MGETITGNIDRLAAPPSRSADTAAGGSTPRKQASGDRSTSAAAAGRTPAAAGSGSTPAGTAAGAAEEKKVSGLAAVTPPPVPETPKKKQRKPRQPKKQETPSSFNADQITALIVSLSSIFATREGLEMFVISEMEARQIANPLANMIEKSEQLKGLSEHADGIALVTACVVIMLPRVMLYMDAQKQKKIKAAGGAKLVRTDTDERKSNANSRSTDRAVAHDTENDGNSIFAAMPSIAY